MAAAQSEVKPVVTTPINLETLASEEGIILHPEAKDNLETQHTYRFTLPDGQCLYAPHRDFTVTRIQDNPCDAISVLFTSDEIQTRQAHYVSRLKSATASSGGACVPPLRCTPPLSESYESHDTYVVSGRILITKTVRKQRFVTTTPDQLTFDETHPTHYVESLHLGGYITLAFSVSGITRRTAYAIKSYASKGDISNFAAIIRSSATARATTLDSIVTQGFGGTFPAELRGIGTDREENWYDYVDPLIQWAQDTKILTPSAVRAQILPITGYAKAVDSYYKRLALRTELGMHYVDIVDSHYRRLAERSGPCIGSVPAPFSTCITKYDYPLSIEINGKALSLKGKTFTLSNDPPNVFFRIIPIMGDRATVRLYDRFAIEVNTYHRQHMGFVQSNYSPWCRKRLEFTEENPFKLNADERSRLLWMVKPLKEAVVVITGAESGTSDDRVAGSLAAGSEGTAAEVDARLMCFNRSYLVNIDPAATPDGKLIGITAKGSLSNEMSRHHAVKFCLLGKTNSHAKQYAKAPEVVYRNPSYATAALEASRAAKTGDKSKIEAEDIAPGHLGTGGAAAGGAAAGEASTHISLA